jgi:predicted dehydrogenase
VTAPKIAVVGGHGKWGRNIVSTLVQLGAHALVISRGTPEELSNHLLDVQGVAIAVPPLFQPGFALEGMMRGKPLFVEKPLALTIDTAMSLEAMANANKIPVIVDHVHIFNAAYERLRDLLGGQRIISVESTGGGPGPVRSAVSWSMGEAPEPALWDYGPHDVALVLDLMGSWDTLFDMSRTGTDAQANYGVGMSFERAIARLRFGNGFDVKTRKLVVSTTRGTEYLFDDGTVEKLFVDRAPALDIDPTPPLTRALQLFLRCVEGDAKALDDRRVGTSLGVRVVNTLAKCQALLTADAPPGGAHGSDR